MFWFRFDQIMFIADSFRILTTGFSSSTSPSSILPSSHLISLLSFLSLKIKFFIRIHLIIIYTFDLISEDSFAHYVYSYYVYIFIVNLDYYSQGISLHDYSTIVHTLVWNKNDKFTIIILCQICCLIQLMSWVSFIRVYFLWKGHFICCTNQLHNS